MKRKTATCAHGVGLSRKERLQKDRCYQFIKGIAFVMYKRFLDPLIGFVLPALGDFSVLVLNLPYLYFSLFRVKSVSLSIAILYNALLDCLIGLVPFGVGDVLDIFYRSYSKNYRLIVGYVEEDKTVIRQVRKYTFYFVLGVLALIVGIILLFQLGGA